MRHRIIPDLETPKARVESHLLMIAKIPHFMNDFWRRVRVVSANERQCVFEIDVTQEECNPMGTLHGGFIATIIDSLSSATQYGKKNGWIGVSIDLTISYVSPAKNGDNISVECTLIKIGKNLAKTTTVIRNTQTSNIVATGQHTKYNVLPKL
ncbi:hypothetical protein G9A89_016130 [Geosiphon pyriformis]|nr:hypothetical protein G9A89_016130 [Geosiphon pyriformis]